MQFNVQMTEIFALPGGAAKGAGKQAGGDSAPSFAAALSAAGAKPGTRSDVSPAEPGSSRQAIQNAQSELLQQELASEALALAIPAQDGLPAASGETPASLNVLADWLQRMALMPESPSQEAVTPEPISADELAMMMSTAADLLPADPSLSSEQEGLTGTPADSVLSMALSQALPTTPETAGKPLHAASTPQGLAQASPAPAGHVADLSRAAADTSSLANLGGRAGATEGLSLSLSNANTATDPALNAAAPLRETAFTQAFSEAQQSMAGLVTQSGQGLAGNAPVASLMTSAQAAALASPVGSPQWGQDLGQQVVRMVSQGDNRISLHLNPAELGPLTVELKLVEQQAQIQLLSSHAQVRSALEQALPQLRDMLAEQGIELGQSSVGDQRTEQGERQFAGQDARQPASAPVTDVTADADTTETIAGRDVLLDGGVNLYV